jgi:hypothetical protein
MPRIVLYAEITITIKELLVAIKKTETIAPFLQTLFLVIVVGVWVLELAFQIFQASMVYRHNPNLSSYYTTFLYSAIIPLLLFGIATFLNRRYKPSRRVVFENTLIALVGMTFCSFVGFAAQMATMAREVIIQGPLGWWWLEILTAVASFVIYVGILLFARRTGRWN